MIQLIYIINCCDACNHSSRSNHIATIEAGVVNIIFSSDDNLLRKQYGTVFYRFTHLEIVKTLVT